MTNNNTAYVVQSINAYAGQHNNAHTGQHKQGGSPMQTMLSTFPFAKCCNIPMLDLQRFAEGCGEGAAQGTGEGTLGRANVSGADVGGQLSHNLPQANDANQQNQTNQATTKQTGETLSRAAKRQARASGEKVTVKHPLSAVQYGKGDATLQAAAVADGTEPTKAGTAQDAPTSQANPKATQGAQDKDADFEKMIRGEYKEQFANRAQNIINQRFKQVKQLEAKSQQAQTLMQQLAKRYGVNANDAEAILRAAQADESYTEKEANTRGLSVDEMRKVKQLESENAQLRSTTQRQQAKEAAQKLYQTWLTDGEKLKAVYPGFDLKNEVNNPEFTKLIRAGVPLRKAYETSHLDQILGGAMQYTADQVTQNMAARIADRSSRPAENGTTPHAGAVVKPDVAGLSRADREEIERRVMRGEKILF